MPTVKHLIFVLNFYIKEDKNFREYLLRRLQLVKDSGISAIYKASVFIIIWINNYNLNFPSSSSILRLNIIIIQNFCLNFFPIIIFFKEVRMKSISQAKPHTCPGSTEVVKTRLLSWDVTVSDRIETHIMSEIGLFKMMTYICLLCWSESVT